MAPKTFAALEDSSHESSLTSHTSSSKHHHHGRGLELSSSSHSIAKSKALKKGPIIRVVHVFAPKHIKTDVGNFRTLVQQLTGNHPSSPNTEAEEAKQLEAKEEISHDHGSIHGYCSEAAINPAKGYPKKRAATVSAMLRTQIEEEYEDPFLHYANFQARLPFNHAGFATRINNNANGYFPTNEAGLAKMEERDGYDPVTNQYGLAGSEEGINYFAANYHYNDAYSHGSPSSLDSTSSREDSLNYEGGNNSSVLSDDLELMGDFNLSYPLINLDDQLLPQLFMSSLDTKLVECSLPNPTW